MLEGVFEPVGDWGLLILRVGLGIIFLVHGWPKLNPNSPMKGPAGFVGFLRQLEVPLPALLGWVVILLETAGAVLLVLGVATRIIALGLAIDMLAAIRLVKRGMAKARFMELQASGWEFEFALMVAALALLFTGPGAIALPFLAGW
ncbi:MAG: DoxX family protein [Armatimonadota bacterium]|nr:DoxX family protein [Armatimonadota bacterium]MDR7450776.1 DoxX family protein [Armatimonadota bacterium]MDR7466132.1 DoxX family protein [Armatimonadota bacterium]MDR7493831.1 DoxX family protein [Armatimonadota bacterium]MDR7499008.1 DoxX family protein [Armatimonadota bacterium]